MIGLESNAIGNLKNTGNYRDGNKGYEAKSIVKWLNKKKKLDGKTGKYDYCNSGYVALARIVENISGKNFHTFMRETFFKPLGMYNTKLRKYRKDAPKVIRTYTNQGIPIPRTTCMWVPGDGGVYTNIKDMQKWGRFLAGESRLGNAIPKLMTTKSTRMDSKYGYGIWLSKTTNGRPRYMHGGVWAGAKTGIQFVPSMNLFAITLANNEATNSMATVANNLLDTYLESEDTSKSKSSKRRSKRRSKSRSKR